MLGHASCGRRESMFKQAFEKRLAAFQVTCGEPAARTVIAVESGEARTQGDKQAHGDVPRTGIHGAALLEEEFNQVV